MTEVGDSIEEGQRQFATAMETFSAAISEAIDALPDGEPAFAKLLVEVPNQMLEAFDTVCEGAIALAEKCHDLKEKIDELNLEVQVAKVVILELKPS